MTEWTPENNRIQWVLLTKSQKDALMQHEGEFLMANTYGEFVKMWQRPTWSSGVVYRSVKPKKTGVFEGWINIYPRGNDVVIYTSKEEADRFAAHSRIACIHIKQTWTEGEGLNDE